MFSMASLFRTSVFRRRCPSRRRANLTRRRSVMALALGKGNARLLADVAKGRLGVNCRHSSVTVTDRTITGPPASKLHCQEADTAAKGFPRSQLAGWSD